VENHPSKRHFKAAELPVSREQALSNLSKTSVLPDELIQRAGILSENLLPESHSDRGNHEFDGTIHGTGDYFAGGLKRTAIFQGQ